MVEIIVAITICIFNFISGILFYHLSINKNSKTFSKIFFFSTSLRYVINLFLLFFFLKYLKFEPFKFSLTFLVGTYFLILLEVVYLNSKRKFLILHNYQNNN